MAKQLGAGKQDKKHWDLAIEDANGKKVGEIRVKPNTILWAPTRVKGWWSVPLADFDSFMRSHKNKVKH